VVSCLALTSLEPARSSFQSWFGFCLNRATPRASAKKVFSETITMERFFPSRVTPSFSPFSLRVPPPGDVLEASWSPASLLCRPAAWSLGISAGSNC